MAAPSIRFDQHKQPIADQQTSSERWFSHKGGKTHSGFWSSEPGSLTLDFTDDQFELCTILEGRVILTDISGTVEIYSPGDTFIMPGGFKGVWESVSLVRKFYLTCNIS